MRAALYAKMGLVGSYIRLVAALVVCLSAEAQGQAPVEAWMEARHWKRAHAALEARCLLATLYEREGRKADAVRELQAAVRLDPAFEPARAGLKRLQHS